MAPQATDERADARTEGGIADADVRVWRGFASAEVEHAYQQEHATRLRPTLRAVFALGLVFNVATSFFDYGDTGASGKLAFVRFGLSLPLNVAALLVAFAPMRVYRRLWQLAASALSVGVAYSVLLGGHSIAPSGPAPPAAYVLAISAIYGLSLTPALSGVGFRYAAGVAVALVPLGPGLRRYTDPATHAASMVMLLEFMLVGLAGAFLLERRSRREFVLRNNLDVERRRSESLLAELAHERAKSEAALHREIGHQVAARSREIGAALARGDAPDRVRGELAVGDRFDRYRVLGSLGAGGMGQVYRVERVTDGAPAALKVISGHLSAASASRFARETEIGAQLRHPNLVSIFDVGVTSNGAPFLAMELIGGGSLEDRRVRFGDAAWALPLIRQIARGLRVLHDAEIVHRDLKPANILIDERREGLVAKISDFGISGYASDSGSSQVNALAETAAGEARDRVWLTATGAILGTPLYMAPEAAAGARAVDRPADVFAFGLMAWEMLVGTAAFRVPAALQAMAGGRIEPPRWGEDVEVPEDVRQLVTSCLAQDPAYRPSTSRVVEVLGG